MSRPQLTLLSDPATAALSDFALFWRVYPRKVAKLDAERAWAQTRRQRPPIEEVIAAIQAQIQSGQWDDVRYCPHPATWLRAGRWDDE